MINCSLFTHKWLRSKLSNAILTLKYSLSISNIDGVKKLLQMSHGLCVTKCNVDSDFSGPLGEEISPP